MNKTAKIIAGIAGGLVFASLVADIIVANWWPTVAVLATMGVAGFFTGVNALARGAGDADDENSRKKLAERPKNSQSKARRNERASGSH